MHTSILKYLVLSSLSLGLMACGEFKPVSPNSWAEREFNTQNKDSAQSVKIKLRGQNFEDVSSANKNFLGLAPTQLASSIVNGKYENSELEVRLKSNIVRFNIDLKKGLRFNELDESGRYSAIGSCVKEDCTQMAIKFEDIQEKEVAEVLYSRSYEYLTQSNSSNFAGLDQELIDEAIRYRFPVARHTVRVNNSRDLELLVIERPLVDEVSEDFDLIIKEDAEITAPKIETRPARQENQRIELSADEHIVFEVDKISAKKDSLQLTPNPFEAYQLKLPPDFFGNANLVQNTSEILPLVPVEEQKPMEPAARVAAIARAFVEQGVQIYRNACNIYVRSVLSLAGYTHGGHNLVSNQFHKLFQENNQGLRDWESRKFIQNKDMQDLKSTIQQAQESLGFVAQVDRTSLGRQGHTGILVMEEGQLVIYDSSLDKRGPRRTVISAEKLLNKNRPILKIHSHPLLISPMQ